MDNPNYTVHRKRIGELLVEAGILRREDLPVGLQEAQRRALKLGEVLVMLSYLSADDLENVLQAQTMLADERMKESEALDALKCAAANRLSFPEALKQVRNNAVDKRAQYELELALLNEKLKDLERIKGPTHRDVGGTCVSIGDLHADAGEASAAESSYKRALQIFERSFGRRHLRVAHCQAKLADLLTAQARYKEAEMLYWYVLDTTQGAWGQDHMQVAHCHKSLGHLLEAQGRLREAEQFYLTSLRIIEKVAGPDSPDLTDGLRTLASFWRKQGKKPAHKRLGDLLVEAGLLTSAQLENGLTHARGHECPLGQALVQLGFLSHEDLRPALQAQLLIGDGVLPLQLAVKALRAARQGRRFEEALQDLGWEPDRFTTDELLVLIETAEELISAEAALGAQHAGVAVLSIKLADKYIHQNRLAEAEPLYKRSLSILEKTFGPDDAEVAIALAKLANLHMLDSKPEQAQPLLERALDIRRRAKGKMSLDAAECLELLGLAHEQSGNCAQAEAYFQEALTIKEDSLGPNNEKTKETLERLANSLFAQGKLQEAEEMFARLIEGADSKHESNQLWKAAISERLGEIKLAQKEYSAAQKHFEEALAVHERIDRSSLSAAQLMEKFAALLEATGNLQQSREMLERAQTARRLRT